jgi:hypothetical protein
MGVLQAFNSSAKLHQDTGVAPGGPSPTWKATGTGGGSASNTAKSQLAASKGNEIAIALNLPTLPSSTQKMLAVMFQGKKFIRYPFGAADSTATVSKIFYRAAGAALGTLYYADPNSNTDAADLTALGAAGAVLPVHSITEIVVGNGAHPAPPTGTTVQPANCLSFVVRPHPSPLPLSFLFCVLSNSNSPLYCVIVCVMATCRPAVSRCIWKPKTPNRLCCGRRRSRT